MNKDFEKLSNRQVEIVTWVLMGCTNKEIGIKLFIEDRSVKCHLTNIFKLLGISSRASLISKYKAAQLDLDNVITQIKLEKAILLLFGAGYSQDYIFEKLEVNIEKQINH